MVSVSHAKFSITHKFVGEVEAELDVMEPGEDTPHHQVAPRGPGESGQLNSSRARRQLGRAVAKPC